MLINTSRRILINSRKLTLSSIDADGVKVLIKETYSHRRMIDSFTIKEMQHAAGCDLIEVVKITNKYIILTGCIIEIVDD